MIYGDKRLPNQAVIELGRSPVAFALGRSGEDYWDELVIAKVHVPDDATEEEAREIINDIDTNTRQMVLIRFYGVDLLKVLIENLQELLVRMELNPDPHAPKGKTVWIDPKDDPANRKYH